MPTNLGPRMMKKTNIENGIGFIRPQVTRETLLIHNKGRLICRGFADNKEKNNTQTSRNKT